MNSRIIVAAGIAAFGVLAPASQAYAGSLDGGGIKSLFPGYFEATVQGYRILFSGYRDGSLQGEAYGRQDRGRWFVASAGGNEILKFRRAPVAQK